MIHSPLMSGLCWFRCKRTRSLRYSSWLLLLLLILGNHKILCIQDKENKTFFQQGFHGLDYNKTTALAKCLSYIVDMNIDQKDTVLVLQKRFTTYNDIKIIQYLINSKTTILLHQSTHHKIPEYYRFIHKLGYARFVIILTSSIYELRLQLNFLTKLHIFNSRVYFIVGVNTYADVHNYDDDVVKDYTRRHYKLKSVLLSEAFSILWNYYIFNTVIIYCQQFRSIECGIYTWFPYQHDSKCGLNTRNYIQVDKCEFTNNVMNMSFYVNYLNRSRKIYVVHPPTTCSNIPLADSLPTCKHSPHYSSKTNSVKNRDYEYDDVNDDDDDDDDNDGNGMGGGNTNDEDTGDILYKMKIKSKYFVKKFYETIPTGVFEYRSSILQQNPETINRHQQLLHSSYKWWKVPPKYYHFFQKIPPNLLQCPYKGVLFIWPPFITPKQAPWVGIEHKLILEISRFMNFKIQEIYSDLSVTNVEHNVNSTDSEKTFMQTSGADLAFGNLYPSIEQHQLMDYSAGYLYDQINWIVPLAGNKPVWLNLMYCFSTKIWVTVGTVLVTFTLLYICINRIPESRTIDKSIWDCITVAAAANRSNMPHTPLARFFLFIWIFYCFHIHLIYQVQLMSILTTPLTEHQISTPAEIISKKLVFGFSRNFEVHLQRMNTSESRYFLNKNRMCNFQTCIEEMTQSPFATLGNRMYIQYSLAFHEKSTKIFTIPNPVAKSFIEMYMKKGFPLRDKMNFLIRRMIEIGYLASSQDRYRSLLANVSGDNILEFRENDFLELEHFLGAFIFLISGQFIAFIVFIVEFYGDANCIIAKSLSRIFKFNK